MVNSERTILIVDDEADICELMADRLQMEGYRTLTAGSGNSAIEKLKQKHNINLVITDVRMPDGDGIKVLQENQSIEPPRPIVIITGFSDYSEDELKEQGAFAVISKPINYEELLSVINKSLK